MGDLVCPLCGSYDYDTDDDGVIIYCHNCEENANGYIPLEFPYDEMYFCCSEDEHNYLKDLEFMEED